MEVTNERRQRVSLGERRADRVQRSRQGGEVHGRTAFEAGFFKILPRCTYRIATSLFLCPVCAMMSARLAPPRAAPVANPLRRLCPATRVGSMPTRLAARLTISATARPERLFDRLRRLESVTARELTATG
jgi:hypothetical protein